MSESSEAATHARGIPPELLLGIALVLTHGAMLVEIGRASGAAAWWLGPAILGSNALFAAILRGVLRFRPRPLMAIFSTTAMTEAVLWRSAWQGRNEEAIAYVGLFCALLLLGFVALMDRARRNRRGR